MKGKIISLSIIFLMVLVSCFGAVNISAETEQTSDEENDIYGDVLYVPGEILIGFKDKNYLNMESYDFLKTQYPGGHREAASRAMCKAVGPACLPCAEQGSSTRQARPSGSITKRKPFFLQPCIVFGRTIEK